MVKESYFRELDFSHWILLKKAGSFTFTTHRFPEGWIPKRKGGGWLKIVRVNGNWKLIATIVAALICFRPQKLINLIRYSQFLRVVFVNKHSQLSVERDEGGGCDLTSLPSTLNGRTFVEDTWTSRRKEKMKNYSHFFKVFN